MPKPGQLYLYNLYAETSKGIVMRGIIHYSAIWFITKIVNKHVFYYTIPRITPWPVALRNHRKIELAWFIEVTRLSDQQHTLKLLQ